MPLPRVGRFIAIERRPLSRQVCVSDDSILWLHQIWVRIEAGVQEGDRYAFSSVLRISIQPDTGRDDRKTIRRVPVIMTS